MRQSRLLLHQFLPATNRFVVLVSLMRRRHHLPITHDQIWSDDHSNIIHLQALAGVDVADLLNGVFSDDPQAAILIQAPLAYVVIADNDVGGLGVFLAEPRSAVTRGNASLVSVVLLLNSRVHCLRGVEHLELILAGIEQWVGCRVNPQYVIQPCQIAIRATAAKLGRQRVFLNCSAFSFGKGAYSLLATNVAQGLWRRLAAHARPIPVPDVPRPQAPAPHSPTGAALFPIAEG